MRLTHSIVLAGLLGASAASVPGQATNDDAPSWDVNQPTYSVSPKAATLDIREGTWMSLDVHPDGEQIVFDLLGDIYQIPIGGGEARSLTSGHAWDMQPRFSPDGDSIAFTSDRAGGDNIWTLNIDSGDLHQVTYEEFRLLNNPTWSPDGQYIAARKHFTTSRSLGTGEVWLYHANSGKQQSGQLIVERPSETFQKEQGEPMFSPDGSGIYYTLNSTPGNTFIYHQDSNTELFQIRKVDLASGEVTTVAGGPGGAVRPTPSPDGKKLAYVKRVRAESRLFVKDLASGEEHMVYDQLDQDMQETWAVHGLYPNMDWTPDSRSLVFWAGGKLWQLQVENLKLSEIPFHVKDQRDIYPAPRFKVDVAPDTFRTRMVRFAQPSPDGDAVVFESLGRLYVKRGDSAPKAITSDGADGFDYSPVWSPDGDEIYFLRWNDEALSSIRRVSARGGKSRQVSDERGQFTELAIDSDGKTLAYRKRPASDLLSPDWAVQPGIYLMDIRSGDARFVSKRGTGPHFGPDQNRIYVHERAESASGRDSQTAITKLISMTRDGYDVRDLAQAEFATRIVMAPSGKHVAFENSHHMYVADLLPSGKPVQLDAAKPAFPSVKVSTVGGTYLYWNRDGSAVSWSVGPQMKTVAVADAMAAGFTAPQSGIDLSMEVEAAKPQTRIALTNAASSLWTASAQCTKAARY